MKSFANKQCRDGRFWDLDGDRFPRVCGWAGRTTKEAIVDDGLFGGKDT